MSKLPQAWLEAGVKLDQGSKETKITARVDMSAEVAGAGLCPECRKPMVTSHANGHEVYVCQNDRITLPKADHEENQ